MKPTPHFTPILISAIPGLGNFARVMIFWALNREMLAGVELAARQPWLASSGSLTRVCTVQYGEL